MSPREPAADPGFVLGPRPFAAAAPAHTVNGSYQTEGAAAASAGWFRSGSTRSWRRDADDPDAVQVRLSVIVADYCRAQTVHREPSDLSGVTSYYDLPGAASP